MLRAFVRSRDKIRTFFRCTDFDVLGVREEAEIFIIEVGGFYFHEILLVKASFLLVNNKVLLVMILRLEQCTVWWCWIGPGGVEFFYVTEMPILGLQILPTNRTCSNCHIIRIAENAWSYFHLVFIDLFLSKIQTQGNHIGNDRFSQNSSSFLSIYFISENVAYRPSNLSDLRILNLKKNSLVFIFSEVY